MTDVKRVHGLFAFYRGKEGDVPRVIASAVDTSGFAWTKRPWASEGVRFCAREVVQRTSTGTRATVSENDCKCLTFVDSEGLAVAIVVSKTYDDRPGFSALGKTMQLVRKSEMYSKFKATWAKAEKDMNYKELEGELAEIMKQYMDPLKADKLLAIKYELEETKQIMYKNIDDLLAANEKLEDLIKKSEDLAALSKGMATKAKELNRCCVIL